MIPKVYNPGMDQMEEVTQEWCDKREMACFALARIKRVIERPNTTPRRKAKRIKYWIKRALRTS